MIKKEYFSYRRPEMLNYIKGENLKVLEVGCGSGQFLKPIMGRINIAYGVEPNKAAAEKAGKEYSKIFNGTFQNFSTSKRFDYIVFNDVLEHMIDPLSALIKANKLLNNQGKIIASIPNFLYYFEFKQFLLSADFKYKESGIFDKTHLRFFTKKSIIRLFEDAHLYIEKIEGIHLAKSRLLNVLNIFLLNRLQNFKPMQYAVIAKKQSK